MYVLNPPICHIRLQLMVIVWDREAVVRDHLVFVVPAWRAVLPPSLIFILLRRLILICVENLIPVILGHLIVMSLHRLRAECRIPLLRQQGRLIRRWRKCFSWWL